MTGKTHILKKWVTATTAKAFCGRWMLRLRDNQGDFRDLRAAQKDEPWCKHCRKAKDFIDDMRARK